jgi:hypothetical protein
MDQFISGIISGVVANTITSFCSYAWTKKSVPISEKEKLPRALETDSSLLPILQKAETALATSGLIATKRNAEKLRIILVSPEVDAIVRQIFATQLADGSGNDLESIRAELLTLLSLRLGQPETALEPLTAQLFDALIKFCDRALGIAIDRGALSAHEAKSGFRHRLVMDELASIKKNLDFLRLVKNLDGLRPIDWRENLRI